MRQLMIRNVLFLSTVLFSACGDKGSAPSTQSPSDQRVAQDATPIKFKDVTKELGLPAALNQTTCVVFDDFTGDGLADLFIGGSFNQKGRFYEGSPNGFIPRDVAFSQWSGGRSCAIGDFDRDGKPDLIQTNDQNEAIFASDFLGPQPGIHNVALSGGTSQAQSLYLADLDQDGWLDLYVDQAPKNDLLIPDPKDCVWKVDDFYCLLNPPEPRDQLLPTIYWSQQGTFGSTDTTLPIGGTAQGMSIVDWDQDGALDLFVNHDFFTNQFYHNQGQHQFQDMLPKIGGELYNHAMGSAFADFDQNGKLGIYVADLGPDQYWLQDDTGMIHQAGIESHITDLTQWHSGWCPQAYDFNNDGDLDIFVTNTADLSGDPTVTSKDMVAIASGHYQQELRLQNHYVLFNDHGVFGRILIPGFRDRVPFPAQARSWVGDFNGDGLMDVAVLNLNTWQFYFYQNVTEPTGRWDIFQPLRKQGGRWTAQGTRMEIRYSDGYVEPRDVASGGCMYTAPTFVHVGLGSSRNVDSIGLDWIGGAHQEFPGPFPVNQRIPLQEQ